jgi:beta-glucosidase
MNVEKIISEMTLEEKAAILSGLDSSRTKAIERLGIPSVQMCDGPNGLRKQESKGDRLGIGASIPAVCLPTASAAAASFDVDLAEAYGKEISAGYTAENVAMNLGPAVNIKRSPLCGRNFEYWSEDPYLAGKLGAALVKSVQSTGTASCVKHYAANNQETLRMSGDSVVDERTLNEIYLAPFEMIVKEAKPRSVMCAYNRVNGVFCAENKYLLTDKLRAEWGFDGFVVTDWGAVKDIITGIKAGLDFEMPGGSDENTKKIIAAVKSGELTEKELNIPVCRILNFVMEAASIRKDSPYDFEAGYKKAVEFAKNCAVLLKNDNRILPLDTSVSVAFIGEFAVNPRYQGSGSSFVNSAKVSNALAAAKGLNVVYARGYDAKSGTVNSGLIAEAVEAAQKANIAVIFAGLPQCDETEGADRETLDLSADQNALIAAVTKVQPNTVVVLHNGSPVIMPWINDVRAVLEMYLAGDGSGEAAVSLLFGNANPCGKLAETFPLKLSDTPSYFNFPGERGVVEYREGIFVGYRYYDKKQMPVLFPFGHGLSYTTFEYSNIRIEKPEISDAETLTVTVSIKNTGMVAGKEIVQLYVKNHTGKVIRPVRELRAFAKVALRSGETKDVVFTLDKRAFAYYEKKVSDFVVETGVYGIEIAASSRDIRLSTNVTVLSTAKIPCRFSRYSTMEELGDSPEGRAIIERLREKGGQRGEYEAALGEGAEVMVEKMMKEMTLGTLVSYGMMTEEQLQGMLSSLNKQGNAE